ncbi:MAG TPA: hypothetical protein VGR10_01130, partial [Thermoleophilaceae bacterium]|nr:hypothetical protein [Thermoleophilaceae bacterium]
MIDRRTMAAAPAALLALLLLVATFFEGAFDVRHWAPLALFGLVVLGGVHLTGAHRPVSRPVALALAAVWAASAEQALEGGAQAVLYASLVSVAVLAVPGPRQMRAIGAMLVGGVAAIAVVTLLRMHLGGAELFVAGRLESPV